MRSGSPAEGGRLLCILFLWIDALSAGTGREGVLRVTYAQRINVLLRKLPAWPIYIAGALPPFWYFYLGITGGLGVEPINAFEHKLGLLGLQLLIAVLAITPLRTWTKVNLIKFRRALGLVTFYIICCHLLVWLVLDVQIPSQIWADILKRPYITIGMAGLLLMIPVAVTSNDWSIRKLGPKRWKRLHQFTYACIVLGGIHYVLVLKGFQLQPIVYLTIIFALLATRVKLPKVSAILSRA